MQEIVDAIAFYDSKIKKLEAQPVFKDPAQIRKSIEIEQREIEKEATAKVEKMIGEAYELARDEFQAIMDGNRLKMQTGADSMNWTSPDFHRADRLKGERDALQRILNNPAYQQK